MADGLDSRANVTLGELFLAFAKIGLCGISSLLVWARRVIVEERHWMSEAEFVETISVCQFLPGPVFRTSRFTWGQNFAGPSARLWPFWASLLHPWRLASRSERYISGIPTYLSSTRCLAAYPPPQPGY